MKIHFDEDLTANALKIVRESIDLSETANDIDNIDKIKRMLLMRPTPQLLSLARKFDILLRKKYPTISEMLVAANRLPFLPASGAANNAQDPPYPQEYKNLEQDYFGILCDVLMKKGITASIEQFIKKLD